MDRKRPVLSTLAPLFLDQVSTGGNGRDRWAMTCMQVPGWGCLWFSTLFLDSTSPAFFVV
ncbi:hypothetical protein M440DRAFT_1162920 [Trichoderma longibrachiatum ATCC 18648]|uniref:Uncharacterized protein n=1 Tax=Trichoderma longibrachiatum ATCC 18648 TaxID=983965 RepID=A0A2T4CCB3_TRILO|nr:hypothetical protein M440DRAFT_1162920 [Trichoderma longibrachiatum ATCC 18648]